MAEHLGVVQRSGMSRRSFVKTGAVTAAALGLAGSLAACGNQVVEDSGDATAAASTAGGEWKSAACWHNCGGRCVNKVLVQDGVIIRQNTDDSHPDSPDYPQQRSCSRGRAQRNHVFSEDRLKYPMKRKNWAPGGGENSQGELRGKDEWERISWDEAIDYIGSEVERVVETYGNRAIYAAGGSVSKFFSLYGDKGFIPAWGTGSFGAWTYTAGPIGLPAMGVISDRMQLRKCDTVIMIGNNPAWSSAGNPTYHALQIKKAGAKFIAIDPFYNDSYAIADAEWIPCRPSTDIALLIGIAHEMLVLDDAEQLIDWDFLNKYTIGFDAEHMPEGEDPNGNFKDYVLGTFDGMPKDPAWASKITGVAPEKITELAREMGKDKKCAILTAWASARTHNSDNLPQMIMTIGAMGGHFGKEGHTCGVSCHYFAFNDGPNIVSPGSNGLPSIENPIAATDSVNLTELWKAIVEGSYTMGGSGGRKQIGEKRDLDIKIIYYDSMNARLQTTDGQVKGIEAHRKVDMVVTHSLFLTTNARYSDIVLPIISHWEKDGGFLTGNREMVIYFTKIVEPMFECLSDDAIAVKIGERLGLTVEEVFPFSEKQQLFNQILGATVTTEDGTKEPLVTIAAEEISEWGCEGEPQEGKITLAELCEQGVYSVPRSPGDGYEFIGMEDFVKNPEENGLTSESGLMEIYSKELRDGVNGIGYSTIEAIPTYITAQEGIEATFSDFDAGVKGEYPYQAFNPHYLRRSHSVLDNVQWLRETWPNPVFMNASDASDIGVGDGDTVLVTSPHGKSLRTVCATNRFMPGVVGVPHGAWVDVDESTGIDHAGSDNYLTGQIQSGQGISGWNTQICKVEKYSEKLTPDVELPQRIPAAQM